MQHTTPWQAAALYHRPSVRGPAYETPLHELAAHANAAGHRVQAVHAEPHPGADTARRAVLDLARAGQLDAVLVARLSQWGRSTPDLVENLRVLHAHGVALHPLDGLAIDLSPPHGARVLDALDAVCAFEREVQRERAHRGHAAARAAGKSVGRQPGQRIKADRLAPEVLALAAQGLSQRAVAARLSISKNTVGGILARARAAPPVP